MKLEPVRYKEPVVISVDFMKDLRLMGYSFIVQFQLRYYISYYFTTHISQSKSSSLILISEFLMVNS